MRSKWPIQRTSIPSDGGDLVHRLEAGGGLDLDERHDLAVDVLDRGRDAVGRPVVPEEHPETARSGRRIPGGVGDPARLLGALDVGHHHSGGADVERPCDEIVRGVRHPQERHRRHPARGGENVAHPLDPVTRVLEVEEDEVGPGRGGEPGDARSRELGDHRPQGRPRPRRASA